MTIRTILAIDAATCAAMGIGLVAAAHGLAGLLGLPQDLLSAAGWLLLPIAVFMAALAWQAQPWRAGVWVIILGNLAWVIASIAVLFLTTPNALGAGFLAAQALLVALLALAEAGAARNRPQPA